MTIDKLIMSVNEEMKTLPEVIVTRRKLVSELNDLLVAKVKGMLHISLPVLSIFDQVYEGIFEGHYHYQLAKSCFVAHHY